ncbi:MAG: UbiA family prenyltransferase [Verrucomicrobiota bacterium]
MIEYLKICRIDHWLKNIFILFGHAVAIVLVPSVVLDAISVGIIIFSLIPACFIASANYILNEILDAPFDRLHPTKKNRGIPAGKVKVSILWWIFAGLIVAGFALAIPFKSPGYLIALGLLLLSGLVYNIPPVRLKDRVFLDVIAESFNNPIRLWLGWFALVPSLDVWPPLPIVFAWWSFGALLMTGKRYAEFRFIDDKELSGKYRKSFQDYSEQKLIIAMITYANFFCFFTGVAMTAYQKLNNLVFVFPMIALAIIAYFRQAMSIKGAKLEPEQLMRNVWVIAATIITAVLALWLLGAENFTQKFSFWAKDWMAE